MHAWKEEERVNTRKLFPFYSSLWISELEKWNKSLILTGNTEGKRWIFRHDTEQSYMWNPSGNHCPETGDQISPRYWNIHREQKDYPALNNFGRLLISHLTNSRARQWKLRPSVLFVSFPHCKRSEKSMVHRTAEEVLLIPKEKSAHCKESILLLIPSLPLV